MKIWGDIPKVSGVYDKHRNIGKVEKSAGVTGKKDVVSISNQAKDFQTVMKALKEVPDIRTEKVRELSEKYDAGSYDPKDKDVADKIVSAAFEKKA
ncbi:MAG: flagellar biosynthesis anti-sigma factor FlgM [Clostridia bacterium]|nr:flagellar biosynthesis anti-sigma factor FlgM [Clostridia bacterium]